MSDEELDEIVYTITSGFYPSMFAGNAPSFGGKGSRFLKGRGRVGARHGSVEGWAGSKSFTISKDGKADATQLTGDPEAKDFFKGLKHNESSLQATKKDRAKKGAKRDSFRIRWNKSNPDFRSKLAAKARTGGRGKGWREKIDIDDTSDAPLEGSKNVSQKKMEEHMTYTKFMGNTNLYKLWGSRVWYQEGMARKEKIEKGLNDWIRQDKKITGAFLNTLYSNKEPALVDLAMSMAKNIFGEALDEENLRKDIEAASDADVAEEAWEESPGQEKVDSMTKGWTEDLTKISKARQLDIKLRMEDGTTLYMDSTEMPIHQANQHGLVEENLTGMKDLIKKAKSGGKEDIENLRQGVITMFIKNTEMYNKTLNKIYKTAMAEQEKPKVYGRKAIAKWMKQIQKENQKSSKNDQAAAVRERKSRVTVAQIGSRIGQVQGDKASDKTVLSYTVHMMMNMFGDARKNYRQGHFVGMIGGERAYASIPLGWKWSPGPTMIYGGNEQKGTVILTGANHTLAVKQMMSETMTNAQAQETHARQVQSYTKGKMMAGARVKGSNHQYVSADLTNRMTVRNPTRVEFNPKGLSATLKKIGILAGENLKDTEFAKNANKTLAQNKSTYQLSEGRGLTSKSKLKFWALPYIGIQEFSHKR